MFFFDERYATFEMFSAAHLVAILVIITLFIVMLVFRNRISNKLDLWLRRTVAVLMIAMEWTFYAWALRDGVFQVSLLPMGMCAISMYTTAIALWTKKEKIFKFIYPWAIIGSFLSLIVADQPYVFPHFRYIHYFGNHGLFLLGNLYLLKVHRFTFTYKDTLKSSLILFIYSLIVYPLNFLLETNHLFLRELPSEVAFMFAFLGVFWPIGFGLAIFILFNLVFLATNAKLNRRKDSLTATV